MSTIVFVSCAAMKAEVPSPAKDLYISPLFRMSMSYARKLKPDAIYILSAYHGLLELETVIAPYDKTLLKSSKADRLAWAEKTLAQISNIADTKKDTFVFLSGTAYYENLVPHMAHYTLPLAGMGLGKRMQFLKSQL